MEFSNVLHGILALFRVVSTRLLESLTPPTSSSSSSSSSPPSAKQCGLELPSLKLFFWIYTPSPPPCPLVNSSKERKTHLPTIDFHGLLLLSPKTNECPPKNSGWKAFAFLFEMAAFFRGKICSFSGATLR